MAYWLKLDDIDDEEEEGEADGNRAVDAAQVLGDESPLEFDRGYASVDDEEDADTLAQRYVHIERADPPEWSDEADYESGGGGEDHPDEQTHAEERGLAEGGDGGGGDEDAGTADAEDTDETPDSVDDAPFDPREYTIDELGAELDGRDLDDDQLDALADAERDTQGRGGALDTIDDHRTDTEG